MPQFAKLTSFSRTLIDDADAATARTTLGLGTTTTAPSTNAYSDIAGTYFGASQSSYMMTPDAWLRIEVGGQVFKIGLYL